MAKYHYVRKTDGSVVDIPEKYLVETLKHHPDWEVIETVDTEAITNPIPSIVEPPKAEAPKFACPLCGFEAKSQVGLTSHKKAHAKDNA